MNQREGDAAVSSFADSSPIQAFGLFWKVEEINWFPGKGRRGEFRLLGRRGWYAGALRMVDFRSQQGIYVLYGNYGPHYVGLTRRQTLGTRLRQHLMSGDSDTWDRFCWFGFKQVLKERDKEGLNLLRDRMPKQKSIAPHTMIKEMEALLIKSMALTNRADSKFIRAEQWEQVRMVEMKQLLTRVS